MKLERFLAKRKKTLEQFLNEMGFGSPEQAMEWFELNGLETGGSLLFTGTKKESYSSEEVPTTEIQQEKFSSSEDTFPKPEDTPLDRPKKSRKSSHEPASEV